MMRGMFVRALFQYIDTHIILVTNRVHLNSARVNADLRYAHSIICGMYYTSARDVNDASFRVRIMFADFLNGHL